MEGLFDLPRDKETPFSPIFRSLWEAKADWQQDGHGIVGPQRLWREEPARPFPMDFKSDQSQRREEPGFGGGQLQVTDGTTTVNGVQRIRLDGSLFTVSNPGGGEADVTLKTTSCT